MRNGCRCARRALNAMYANIDLLNCHSDTVYIGFFIIFFVFVSVASAAIKMDVFGVVGGVDAVTVCRFSRKYV